MRRKKADSNPDELLLMVSNKHTTELRFRERDEVARLRYVS
jgi:hypothetical protein